MSDLTKKVCVACEGGIPPLTLEQVREYLPQVVDWHVINDNQKISRVFTFADFRQALDWVNKVGELAEREGHHPDIVINYNRVTLELWTHAIGGLSENDFILAAKIARLV